MKKYQNLVISNSGKSHNKIVKLKVENFKYLHWKVSSWKFWAFEFNHVSLKQSKIEIAQNRSAAPFLFKKSSPGGMVCGS